MNTRRAATSSHALLASFVANGIDRVFLVPGESYLGILDALADFPEIDVVTCRHESGAAFMACADGRLTGRPGVVLVSRGPGAANAAIGLHTAEQDAIPLILVVGQVPKKDLRRGAFQEIDYAAMYGSIAKRVREVTDPADLEAAGYEAIRCATSGTPGPVVLAIPEDVQQARVEPGMLEVVASPAVPAPSASVARIGRLIESAKRPILIAGGEFATDEGRAALLALAQAHSLPVMVSFRRHDLFPNDHPLYAGDLGLANPPDQLAALESSDLVLALGTRLGDITTQGFSFPRHPRPAQTLVHCHRDSGVVGRRLAADVPVVADAAALARALSEVGTRPGPDGDRKRWLQLLAGIHERIAAWPAAAGGEGVSPAETARALARMCGPDVAVCLDAGSFAAPFYRHFPFVPSQRLMAPISGAMGYGVPASISCALREPRRKVVCLVGDGGFAMTGNEMIAAVARALPILFVVSNNDCYGSIRIHQERTYPGRYVGTSLVNPDIVGIATAFGMRAERVTRTEDLDGAIRRGLRADRPYLVEIASRHRSAAQTGDAPPAAFD